MNKMKNLRIRFYVILFVIFLVISISFAAIISYSTNYNINNTKEACYNLFYDRACNYLLDQMDYINDLFTIQNSTEVIEDKSKIDIYKFLNKDEHRIFDYEIYVQQVRVDSENDIVAHTLYSSEDSASENALECYDKSKKPSQYFVPSYDVIKSLYSNGDYFGNETINLEDNSSKKRIFYSKYFSDKDYIVTCIFYESDVQQKATEYSENIGLENQEKVAIFLIVMVVILIILFVILSYIESNYYNKLKNQFLLEKLKIDEKYNDLKKVANLDPLTGCYNRKYINEKMILVFKNFVEGHLPSSVILLDIDNFKSVNDTYGHAAGDAVLKNVADVARSCIREEDVFARWGGEEFVIFFKYTNTQAAIIIAEKIRKAIENSIVRFTDNDIRVTVSVGVSVFKSIDVDYTEAIERADDAMYMSKRTGKNRVTLYHK